MSTERAEINEKFLAKISLPVDKEMSRVLTSCLTSVAKSLSLSHAETTLLELSLDEAFTNAVDDFPSSATNDLIHIDFLVRGEELLISIKDKGMPVDYDASYEKPTDVDHVDDLDFRALSVVLIQKGADRVDFFVHGRGGKETRLTKKIALQAQDQKRVRGKRPTISTPIHRFAERKDFPAIRELAWHCYGYSHEELLYDEDAYTSHLASGELVSSILLEPESHALLGHASLKYHEGSHNVPELGLAIANPHFRVPAIGDHLSAPLVKYAREHGADGIFDCSVTTHTASQKGTQKFLGAKACSMLMGITAEGVSVKELQTSHQRKGSTINHYLPFKRDTHTVYCPPQHQQIISEVYDWLELPREYAKSSMEDFQNDSQVFVFPLPDELNVIFGIVNSIGVTTLQELQKGLRTSIRDKRDAMYLFLPLGCSNSPRLVEQCEELGFSFAGIMPHIHNGDDRILMQCIHTHIDTDAIRIYSDNSRRLAQYIIGEYQKSLL